MSLYLGTDLISGATKITLETFVDAFYPVGSVFIGTTPTCPLAAVKGTWTLVGTSIITDVSIPLTIPVYGNGKSIGIYNGNDKASFVSDTNYGVFAYTSLYGNDVNSTSTAPSGSNRKTGLWGLTTDTDGNSGIIAKSDNITKTSLTVNIWERTA